MTSLSVILALTITAAALPVVLESGDSPVPARAQLIKSLTEAPDADTAADALLQHYQSAGYPATSVEIEDLNGQRVVKIEVARFGKLWLNEGPPRTEKVAAAHFGQLANHFVFQPELDASLKAFHANPLHRAVPRLQPSRDGMSVDALLQIEQSAPLQFSAGYLDTGAHPLPRERFWLQGEFSDFWNHNSLTTTRLTLSPNPQDFHALQLGTRLFQTQGSEIGINLAYSGAQADTFDAYTWQVSGQWLSPEQSLRDWKSRSALGLTYRRSNNALEFGNSTSRGLADVFQLSANQTLERTWDSGLTKINASLIISPFGDDDDHDSLRPGAEATYGILRTSIWHRQDFVKGWDLVASLAGQWASDPVLQADQIALGGASGLRGLPEQFALGDSGWLGGLELRTPVVDLPNDWKLRPSLFLQNGKAFDDVNDPGTSATTAGIGLQIGHNEPLRASLYSGWRLDDGGAEIHSQLTWKF